MPNLEWRRRVARCPYYATSSSQTVSCSCQSLGIERVKYVGATASDCSAWFGRKCATNYPACPIYRMIEGFAEGEAT